MKHFTFKLAADQAEWIFKPIRTKLDAIDVLMRIIKVILVYQEPPDDSVVGHFDLIVDDMSRLVFVSQRKIYSINFPFRVAGDAGDFRFYNHHYQDVNSKATSSILGFVNEFGVFDQPDVLDFATPIADSCAADRDLWALLRELLLWEEGYIRYDDDPGHVNGHIHPRHHLDVFYSSSATFKLGLRGAIEHAAFADMLNIKTDCRYL